EVLKVDPAEMQRKWVKEYGEVIVMRSLMNRPQVIVASSSGVRHMLQTHPERYDKSNPAFRILNRILGNGVLTTDGDVHRRQRAILNPVFRVKNINALIPVFVQSAHEVRASWNDAFHSQAILTINVSEEMAKPTLDVIGRAGFGYEFNAVSSGQSPLFKSFCTVMDMFTLPNLLFDIYFPFAKWILPTEFLRHARIRRARAQIMDACRTLVADKKRAIEGGGKLGASSDLLSVLLRANMEEADPTKRMSDEETGAQVITFLLAGHETTSVALTWCLDLLSKDARVQAKLREDLVADMPNAADDPSDDLLLSTTNYLEAVTKENLRVQPPVPLTSRYCTIDDTIDGHFIPRGTLVSVYPDVMAKKESVWGADALTFRPERWQESDSETKPFGSFMPFMMGPRNCIGSRFAILEFKAILAVLVRNFEF
ncbi:cytochrome P450, partial [Chytriomyces sp. MP71]